MTRIRLDDMTHADLDEIYDRLDHALSRISDAVHVLTGPPDNHLDTRPDRRSGTVRTPSPSESRPDRTPAPTRPDTVRTAPDTDTGDSVRAARRKEVAAAIARAFDIPTVAHRCPGSSREPAEHHKSP